MKAILLMLGALSAAIIFVGCGTAVGRAMGADTEENYDLMEQEYEEKKKGYAITYSFEIFNECASIGAPQNLDLMSPELGLQENGQWVKDAIIEWENELLEKLNTCMNDKGAYGTIEYDGKPSETWVNRPLNPNDFFSGPGGPDLYPPILIGEYSTNFRFVSSEDDVLKTMESPQFLDKYENNIQTLTIAFNSQIAALEEKRLEEERRERRQKEEEERVASQIQEAIDRDREENARICQEAWAENDVERAVANNCGKSNPNSPPPPPDQSPEVESNSIPQTECNQAYERQNFVYLSENECPPYDGVPNCHYGFVSGQLMRDYSDENCPEINAWPGRYPMVSLMAPPDDYNSEYCLDFTIEELERDHYCYIYQPELYGLNNNDEAEEILERQQEQDEDVAPLAEQAEELAEEEAPIDGTAEERIAALEERVAELTELIRELTEALQPN